MVSAVPNVTYETSNVSYVTLGTRLSRVDGYGCDWSVAKATFATLSDAKVAFATPHRPIAPETSAEVAEPRPQP